MKKWHKYFIGILAFLGVLFIVIFYGSNFIIKKIIEDKLKDQHIAEIYQIKLTSAHINILNMGILVKGITLTPDSSKSFQKKISNHQTIAHIEIKKISLSSISLLKLIRDKQLKVQKLSISKPIINLYKNNQYTSTKTKEKQAVAEGSGKLQNIEFQNITVDNAEVNYYIDADNTADLTVGNINIKISQPIINLKKLHDPLSAISLENLQLEISNIQEIDSKKLFDIKLGKLKYDYKDKSLALHNLSIKPKYNKEQFAAKHKYQSDRFDIEAPEIKVTGFDLNRLLNEKIITAKKVDVNQLILEVYRDKNYPFNTNKYPKLPQEALRSLKQKIEIEEIEVQSANIIYLEKGEGAINAGKVEFKDLGATLRNFGNSDDWIENRSLIAQAQATVYGKGKLNASFYFPLKNNNFNVDGQVGKMTMNTFNSITEPNVGLQINNGTINKLSFKFNANKQHSEGKLSLYYQDLEVSFIKRKETGEIVNKSVTNFIAKTLLPKSNPDKNGQFYEAKIYFEREVNKGVFGYLWKSIFSGIKDTFLKGNKKKDEKEEKKKRRLFH